MTSRTYTAPVLPPSPNQTRGKHWSKHWGEREKILTALTLCNVWPGAFDRMRGPIRVTYTRLYARTPLDVDNCAASVKPVLDALKALGVIEDDKPSVIPEYISRQRKVKTVKEQGFEITLEEIKR